MPLLTPKQETEWFDKIRKQRAQNEMKKICEQCGCEIKLLKPEKLKVFCSTEHYKLWCIKNKKVKI